MGVYNKMPKKDFEWFKGKGYISVRMNKKPEKKYKLMFHDTVILHQGTYSLCAGIRKQLIDTGRYQKNLFKFVQL